MDQLSPTLNYKQLLLDSETVAEFLKLFFEYKKNQDKSLSLRNLSKIIDFKSPSLLSEVLSDKKKVSRNLLTCLLEYKEFSHSEYRYINNLFNIENEKNADLAKHENIIIRKYWSTQKDIPNSISSISLIIASTLEYYKGGLSKIELINKCGFFITSHEISASLNELLDKGLIELKSSRYQLIHDESLKISCSGTDIIKVQMIIERIANFQNKDNGFSCMSFFVDKNDFKEIQKVHLTCLEKIALISVNSLHKNELDSNKKLCMFYSTLLTLEPEENWLNGRSD